MKCALCGHDFDKTKRLEICQGCLGSGCKKIRCPNCGYETLPDPEIGSKIKKFLKNLKKFIMRFKNENK